MTKLFLILFLTLHPLYLVSQQLSNTPEEDELLRQAEFLIKNYQFHKAITLLEKELLHTNNNTKLIWHKLAECHTQLGNLSKAKKYFRNILAQDSSHVQALNQLGKIYLKEDDNPRAQLCYQQLLQLDSTNSYYYKNLAKIKSKQGVTSRAIQLYDSALIFNPDDMESIIALAEIYSELMEVDKTMIQTYHGILEQGFRIDSLNKRLLEFKAENAYQQKEYQSAIDAIEVIFENYQDTTGWQAHMLGMANKQLENWQQSHDWFLWIIAKEEDTEITHYYLGTVYEKLEMYDQSIKHLEMAVDKGISENIHSYYVSLGDVFEANGELSKTIKSYQSAYEHSNLNILLYKLARSCDEYYKDKSIALRYYQRFVDNSKQNNRYTEYSRYRIGQIKEYLHANNDL